MSEQETKGQIVYSVWGTPSEEVTLRIQKLMQELRTEFNGPEFEPHLTVVGGVTLTEEDAVQKFKDACKGLKAYEACVDLVDRGTSFFQCLYLLIHPTPEVVDTSAHCSHYFGYKSSTPYMPHVSLLYADISDEEKETAQQMVRALDPSIESAKFMITHLAMYRIEMGDKALTSWEKIMEYKLIAS